ncbi:MAG: XRE family transcriptional regulator [Proteobacteria bacterium]|nr:XRE family transcriptional regulator [Pseudomonadota bacterium]
MTGITRGSKNVLADLGIEDAEALSTKMRLAVEIVRIIRERKLRQAQAARRLGIPQPKVSALMNYRLGGFSAEKLMRFLTALGRDVEIRIKKNHLPEQREKSASTLRKRSR